MSSILGSPPSQFCYRLMTSKPLQKRPILRHYRNNNNFMILVADIMNEARRVLGTYTEINGCSPATLTVS